MIVKLFDQAREFTALESFCTAKNVINGTHRIQFTAQRRLVPISVQPALNLRDLSWLPGPDSNQRLDG